MENNIVIMKVRDPITGNDKNLKYIIENEEDKKKLIKKVEGLL